MSDQMQILHQRIDNKIHEAYERNTRSYNKRSRVVSFKPDQEVYRKNFVRSNFKKGINSKFGKPWLKCRVTPSLYLLYIFPWKIRLYHIQKNIWPLNCFVFIFFYLFPKHYYHITSHHLIQYSYTFIRYKIINDKFT